MRRKLVAPERWLPVPGHSDYAVSTWGRFKRVRTIERSSAGIKRGSIDAEGYRVYHVDGKRVRAHVLVLTAFKGSCPTGMESCHKNRNRLDNWIGNLYWGTRKQNVKDMERHGTCAGRFRKGHHNPSGMKGKQHSVETRQRMSEIHKKRLAGKTHSAETRQRLSEALKGKTLSAETRKRISESQLKRWKQLKQGKNHAG